MFVIQNREGKYWNGRLELIIGKSNWKMLFTEYLSDAEKYSSMEDIQCTISKLKEYAINLIDLGYGIAEFPDQKPDYNTGGFIGTMGKDIFMIPDGEQIVPRDFCNPIENVSATTKSFNAEDLREALDKLNRELLNSMPKFPDHIPFVPYPEQPQVKFKIKTISQICIEADENKTDEFKLRSLWNYVVENKYKYPLTQLHFIREHIEGYLNEIKNRQQSQKYFED